MTIRIDIAGAATIDDQCYRYLHHTMRHTLYMRQ